MAKREFPPKTILMPLPAALITCVAPGYKPNIITISWIGIVNSEPPMLSISVRQNRHSWEIIKKSGEFVVNLTGENLLKEVDFCGTKSGSNVDKFHETGLTPLSAVTVSAPLIKECPINLECEVRLSHLLGSHEMFVAGIIMTHIDESHITPEGQPDIDKIRPLAYCPGVREYRGGLTKMLARYGRASG